MITAIDSSVLLDVLGADATFGPRSREAVRACILAGGLVACDAVWAEVSGFFSTGDSAVRAFEALGVTFNAMSREASILAGASWKRYRAQGGKRRRVAADFLIGAHAQLQADRLLTRDRGFYRRYFSKLAVIDPSRA